MKPGDHCLSAGQSSGVSSERITSGRRSAMASSVGLYSGSPRARLVAAAFTRASTLSSVTPCAPLSVRAAVLVAGGSMNPLESASSPRSAKGGDRGSGSCQDHSPASGEKRRAQLCVCVCVCVCV